MEGLHTISALTHRQILALVERKVIQAELFDEKRIAEVTDPEKPGQRYCFCRNPQSGDRETATRQRLLDRTRKSLDKIVAQESRYRLVKFPKMTFRYKARLHARTADAIPPPPRRDGSPQEKEIPCWQKIP